MYFYRYIKAYKTQGWHSWHRTIMIFGTGALSGGIIVTFNMSCVYYIDPLRMIVRTSKINVCL
jgi:hypothetical protein